MKAPEAALGHAMTVFGFGSANTHGHEPEPLRRSVFDAVCAVTYANVLDDVHTGTTGSRDIWGISHQWAIFWLAKAKLR